MKKLVKTVSILLAAVLCAGLLAGCGDKKEDASASGKQDQAAALSAEEIMQKCSEAVAGINSYSMTMDMNCLIAMDLGDLGKFDMAITMDSVIESIADPVKAHMLMNMNMDMGEEEEPINTSVESYVYTDGDKLVSYSKVPEETGDEWVQVEADFDADSMLNSDLYKQASEGKIEMKLDDSISEYSGKKVYGIAASISGELMSEMLSSATEAMDLSAEALKAMKLDATFMIDRTSFLPVAVTVDLEGMMKDMFGALLEGSMSDLIQFEECDMVMEYKDFNSLKDIELPDFNASGVIDISDISEDSSSEDTDETEAPMDAEGRYVLKASDTFFAACPVPKEYDVYDSNESELSAEMYFDEGNAMYIDYYFLKDTVLDEYDEYCDAAFMADSPESYLDVNQSEKAFAKVGDADMVYSKTVYTYDMDPDTDAEEDLVDIVFYEGWIEKDGTCLIISFEEYNVHGVAATILTNDDAFMSYIKGLTVYGTNPLSAA